MNSPILPDDRVEMLKALYKTSISAAKLFDNFANRKKDRKVTEVDRVQQLFPELSRGDIVEVFKKLGEFGVGRFLIGRRGSPTRFEWSSSLRSVGRAAQGQGGVVAVADASEADDEADASRMIRHEYRLRADFTAQIELPSDLTGREAARLADFIRTLPFQE